MRYSSGMKAAIIKRILPPNDESVAAVSRETGVSAATIHYWKKRAAEGMLDRGDGEVRLRDRSPAEKFTLLLESRSIDEEQHGEWLRSHGLHTGHLPLWEQELREIVGLNGSSPPPVPPASPVSVRSSPPGRCTCAPSSGRSRTPSRSC